MKPSVRSSLLLLLENVPLLSLAGDDWSPLGPPAACSMTSLAAAGGHRLLPYSSDEFSGGNFVLRHVEPVQR